MTELNNNQRFCPVHGLQGLDQYQVSNRKGYRSSQYSCKHCASERYQKLRIKILKHYSPDLRCSLCSEGHLEFLALDHVNGGGKDHRRSVGDGYSFWNHLKLEGFPEGFRVLCHNCNLKHGCRSHFGTGRPKKPESELSSNPRNIRAREYYNRDPKLCNERTKRSQKKLRSEVINHYGGKCACCGIYDLDVLSIDHTDGGGTAHLKGLGLTNTRFYSWLREQAYPSGFQILCMNCNLAKGFYGQCPHERQLSAVCNPMRLAG